MITDIDQLDLSKRYTYADYLTWRFDDMVELIRGKVFRMAPAPNRKHQWVSLELSTRIHAVLRRSYKPCHIYPAPFDVTLPLPPNRTSPDQIDTVVQPDLSIICDPEKLTPQGCLGAPDWIIEIVSPGTQRKDLNEKFDLYEHAGVGEYWIVYPLDETISVYRLDEAETYQSLRNRPFIHGDALSPQNFPELQLEIAEVFAEY